MVEATGGEILEVLRIVRGLQELVQGLSSRVDSLTNRVDEQSAQLSRLSHQVTTQELWKAALRTQFIDSRTAVEDRLRQLRAEMLEGFNQVNARIEQVNGSIQSTKEHCEDVDKRVRVLEAR